MKSLAVTALLAVCVSSAAYGALIVNPPNPTTVTPVSISTVLYMSDPGWELDSNTHSVTGSVIDIQTTMRRLYGAFPLVITDFPVNEYLGTLPAGSYQVNWSLYERQLLFPPFIDQWGPPTYRATWTTSFTVTPEPATLGLLALAGLAIARRRRG